LKQTGKKRPKKTNWSKSRLFFSPGNTEKFKEIELKKNINQNEYSELFFYGYKINNSDKNRFILLKNKKVISVDRFTVKNKNEIFAIAREFNVTRNFYEYPIKFSEILIYNCSINDIGDLKEYNIKDFYRKLFGIFSNDSLIVIPLSKFI
jgi:hypothetical protein